MPGQEQRKGPLVAVGGGGSAGSEWNKEGCAKLGTPSAAVERFPETG